MSINKEKLDIIKLKGNVLVVANPGTGKTHLLAHKYIDLLKNNIQPENILCLTFTNKAKKVMEERILKLIKSELNKQLSNEGNNEINKELKNNSLSNFNIFNFNISNLNVYTFHSYANENLDDSELLSSNFLRYSIYKYIKDKEILNYSDSYIIEDIAPKLENLIRYIKSFGILPDDINLNQVKKFIKETEKNSKEELDKFAEYFLEIYKYYESIKNKKGIDYNDMLINFLKSEKIKKFDYVLVDELQDVNILEAEIAIKSAKNFFVVGDKKQAIFGFQGGSILNFNKFKNSEIKVLAENFRNSNEVLLYAKEYFLSKTKEDYANELKDLKNLNKKSNKPVIIETEDQYKVACELIKKIKLNENENIAILTRKNSQIEKVIKELKAYNIEYSTTFTKASEEIKYYIITFIKAIFSDDTQEIKNAFFTSFFPCSLKETIPLCENYYKLNEILEKLPKFKELREKIKTVEDIKHLFQDIIIPVSFKYGKEYLDTAIKLFQAFNESLLVLDEKSFKNILDYLQITDLMSDEADVEKKIIVSTVHKAKGKEYSNVIYIPAKTNKKDNYADEVVKAILMSKNINATEELDEEQYRIDFVAITRAEKNLFVLVDNLKDYLNDYSELKSIEVVNNYKNYIDENKILAYSLFLNGNYEEAKKVLNKKEDWILNFIKQHFSSIESVSYSNLKDAYTYLKEDIFKIKTIEFTKTGSDIHKIIEKKLKNESVVYNENLKSYIENFDKILNIIKDKYNLEKTEYKIYVPLSEMGFNSNLYFKGFIDAIFSNNNEILIVDWKSNKSRDYVSDQRQQLLAYKKAYSIQEKIPEEKIKVAIGFIGLKNKINLGKTEYFFDEKQPQNRAYETFSKKINKFLSWINNPETFIEEILEQEKDEMIWRCFWEEVRKKERIMFLNK